MGIETFTSSTRAYCTWRQSIGHRECVMSGQCKPRSWDRGPSLSPNLSILPRSLLSRGEMDSDMGHGGLQLELVIR